jgi:hypothetical protein
MAIAAGTVWEGNGLAAANNVNSGGFNPANTHMATDLVVDAGTENTASPVVSSVSYAFRSTDTHYLLYCQGGTGFNAGWYPIASVSGGKATLNAAAGAVIQTDSTKGYPTPKYVTNTTVGIAASGTTTGGIWSIDYSQYTSADVTSTDLQTDGSGNISFGSSSATVGVNYIGNIVHITTTGTGLTVGWYELTNISGGLFVPDRSPGASKTGGTYYLGGAISLNSNTANQTDSNLFAQVVASNRVFLKGSLTFAVAISGLVNATQNTPIVLEGYQTRRGDAPAGSNRPTISSTNAASIGTAWMLFNLAITGAGASIVAPALACFDNCKIKNTISSAGQSAVNHNAGGGATLINCEIVCYRGNAITVSAGASGIAVIDCYIHDSDIGINLSRDLSFVSGNIIENCVTAAIRYAGSVAAGQSCRILGNTLYGAENKLGKGIDVLTNSHHLSVFNNIFYGFVSGVISADAVNASFLDDFNDYYNNTGDRSNWPQGPNDQTLDPQFSSVSQITGTAGAFVAGNGKIVDTSKNFISLGVVAGQDCVYIKSGTGVTAGIYGISSISTTTNPNDTLNLDINPGTNTTADKAYQITIGHNFAMKRFLAGFPGQFPAGLTTGFPQIGAVQPPRMLQHAAMSGGPN